MQPFHEAVAAFDIEGWLNLHADTRASGVDNLALNPCPICGSTKRKFYVNVGAGERRGRWLAHCCHDQGDLVRLVMAIEGFGDSVEARAYIRYHAGESRTILNVEQRFFTDLYPWRLFRIGWAVFGDVGRVGGRDPRATEPVGTLYDVGAGLRLSSPRASGLNVVHIDLAFPLNADPSIDSVQFVVETKGSF